MIENHSSYIKISDTGICKNCYSRNIIKKGTTKIKKQQFYCKNCKKRFIDYYTYNAYKENTHRKIIQFTKEGLEIRSTARLLKISATTLLKKITTIAKSIQQPPISKGKIYEVDELRTFIKRKSELIWIVYALEKETKNVVSFTIGGRSNKTLKRVITSLEFSEAKRNSHHKKIRNKLHRKKKFNIKNSPEKIKQENNLF